MKLIGDSGYPLSPTLITPVHNAPRDFPAAIFNNALAYCRSSVERSIGILKSTFRCMKRDRTLHYSPETSGILIQFFKTILY